MTKLSPRHSRLERSLSIFEGLSVYSNRVAQAFRTYTRGPRVGLLSELLEKDASCVEFDVSRAYTSFLAEIKHMPVLTSFDKVRPYTGTDIEPYAFYLAHIGQLDAILFPRRSDFVFGHTVTSAGGADVKLDIFWSCNSVHLVKTNGPTKLHDLQLDEECSDKARKGVAHIIYGLCHKIRNRKQIRDCFLDEAEARSNGGQLLKIGPGYITVKQGVKYLSEGYLPIGRLVLDAMRRRLHITVMGLGGDAIAVKFDAVFVRAEHGSRCN